MDIINVLKSRYSTKEFDATKKLSEEDLSHVESLLQLSPSSTNLQPWHFTIATSEEGKRRVAKSTQGPFSFNEKKVLDAAAVIVFSTKTDITESFSRRVLEKEDQDGRYAQEDIKNMVYGGRKMFSDMHKYDFKDQQHWSEKQVYLNLGNFLLGVAHLGIDAVAMEGYDGKVLDEELGLREEGFSSTIIVPIGYRAETDFNQNVPKSRLNKEEIISRI